MKKITPLIRVLLGLLFIISALGLRYFFVQSQTKQKLAGTESINIQLPPIKTSPVPKQINQQPAPANFHYGALMDQESAFLLFGKNEHQAVPVASLTKLMTANVVLDHYQLDEVVTVPKEAVLTIGSKIFLKKGEKFYVRDLLNALLINSANDAAISLALSKYSIDEFVKLMNEKAATIGMRDTHFRDPAGLDDQGVSSAYDIALLLSYSLKKPQLRQIIHTAEKTISDINGQDNYQLKNSNRLVKKEMYFSGIIGGKTGFTPTAGHNLVSAASRDGHTLIAVVISTYRNTKDASALAVRDLLNWGFTNWQWQKS